MSSACTVNSTVDNWIIEEDLPVRATLRVVRRNDPDFGLSQDEIQDRNEYISCYLIRDYEVLIMLPNQDPEDSFFIGDFDVTDAEYSAFHTHDFQRKLKPFDRYGYAMKKILERVNDLAILHSVVTTPEGKANVCRKLESLMELEFRIPLLDLVARYGNTTDQDKRYSLKQKIGRINRRILECRKIWEQFAPRDA